MQAIAAFKQVAAINKSAWGAEARYEIANCYFTLNQLSTAEKAALEVIKVTGSYDYWVAKAYILLGDIYLSKKIISMQKQLIKVWQIMQLFLN